MKTIDVFVTEGKYKAQHFRFTKDGDEYTIVGMPYYLADYENYSCVIMKREIDNLWIPHITGGKKLCVDPWVALHLSKKQGKLVLYGSGNSPKEAFLDTIRNWT